MLVQETWRDDPDGGGMIRLPTTAPDETLDPLSDPLYGWKSESADGYVRIPESELPPIPRKGTWVKIIGLQQDTQKNGLYVEVVEEKDDGNSIINVDGETFEIRPINLVPLPGSEKMLSKHLEVSLKLNGVNCDNCKNKLMEALSAIPGVDPIAIDIKTKNQSGGHPNKLTVKTAAIEEQIRLAIEKLDNNRNKYTIEP